MSHLSLFIRLIFVHFSKARFLLILAVLWIWQNISQDTSVSSLSDKSADLHTHHALGKDRFTMKRKKTESNTCLWVQNVFSNNISHLHCINWSWKTRFSQTKQVLVSEAMQITQFCATVLKTKRSLGEKWITLEKTPIANSPREDSAWNVKRELKYTTSVALAVICCTQFVYICALHVCMAVKFLRDAESDDASDLAHNRPISSL